MYDSYEPHRWSIVRLQRPNNTWNVSLLLYALFQTGLENCFEKNLGLVFKKILKTSKVQILILF